MQKEEMKVRWPNTLSMEDYLCVWCECKYMYAKSGNERKMSQYFEHGRLFVTMLWWVKFDNVPQVMNNKVWGVNQVLTVNVMWFWVGGKL